MSHGKAAIVLLLLCLAWAGASGRCVVAQTPVAKVGIALHTSGRRAVVVRERGRSHVLDIWKHVEAARVEDAREIFLTRKGDFVYLLLQVCGPSKPKPDDHECGAGDECDLIWLRLDPSWREREAKSVRYDSCWSPIVSYGDLKVSGRTAQIEYDDLRDNTQHELTYDADKPEEGLTDKAHPLPKDNP
ncbi:MAG TPA: hypothetical protein VHU19_12055 [Pyrinomonadaceae bacterium]|nr:hypothetical protein [Pyrinomonadaceae bacterium]